MFTHGSFVHQKCSSSTLTNLLFGLCICMWVIDLLVTFPNPYPEALTHPSTLEVLQAKEHNPTPHSSVVFILDSHLNPLKSLGVCHMASTTLYTKILASWNGNGKITFHNTVKFMEINKVLLAFPCDVEMLLHHQISQNCQLYKASLLHPWRWWLHLACTTKHMYKSNTINMTTIEIQMGLHKLT